MSTTKKVLIAIFSIIIIAAFAFLIVWGIINFNKVKEGMAGSGLYTKEDLDNAYNDGFNTALENKSDYENLINSYKDTLATQTDTITKLTGEREELEKSLTACQSERDSLTEQRDSLLLQIDLLKADIDDMDGTIDELTKEKQELIDQHQQTVNRLNAQIANLNTQIEQLNTQIQINITAANQLNSRIAELQKTVAFYEGFVGKLETDEIAVVTFEYGGTVYDIKTVNKGDKVSVADPETSEYLIFKGWTVDGQPIDLTTYTVTKSVRIIADVTYKFVVDFTVDGKTKETQVVEKGSYATEPKKPTKSGYTFKYWTLDGENEVHFDRTPIMANTTFIAKFVRLYTVSFQYADGTEIVSRRIEAGTTTTPARITGNEHLVLKGWKLNGNLVDVSSCVINEDTVFVADVTYMYTVKFIINANQVYNTQSIEVGHTVSVPKNPMKENHTFVGWSLNQTDIVDIYAFTVTEDTIFYGIFEQANFTVRVYNKPYVDMRQNCFKVEKGNIVPLLGADCIKFEQEVASGNKVTNFVANDCIRGSQSDQFKCFAKLVVSGNSISFEDIASVENLVITGDTYIVPIFNDANKYGTVCTVTYYDVNGSLLGTEKVTYGGSATQPYALRKGDNYYDYYYWSHQPNNVWHLYLGCITEDTSAYMVAHRKGDPSWI